jgi:eukaryotic-like serine/threonine-protein kinase
VSACAAGYVEHVDANIALAFADDALTPDERALVERRIDACAVCRGAVAAAARETGGVTKGERPISARQVPNRSLQLAPGEVVGRYVVERPLGAGGMGVVSLARDPELRRAVVIKLVRPDAFDDDLEARLRREAQAMAQLSHPNVVQIFDIGRHGDRVFLAMEFIAGETLDVWLIEKERSAGEIIAMFLQAGAGLEAAHRAGLLHRDFKPTNVLVDRDGIAKVTDFGLARALGAARETAAMQVPRTSGVHAVLTHADERIGTPAYMAPEQIAGEPLDARTDQYALALALLDALVGQQPAHRTIKPSAMPAELDAALAKIPTRAAIIRALALEPAQRWPDLTTFLRALAPPHHERRWWPLVAIAAVGLAGVSTFLALRNTSATGCIAETPRAWQKARPLIEARLAERPRVFAAWHAMHVLDAVDRAANDIGTREVAQCEKAPPAADKACLAKRRAALAQVDNLLADNPWLHVRTIASCDPVETSAEPAAMRAELFGADAARAREIAGHASGLGDDLLHADALDLAANLEVAAGHFEEAATDFIAAAAVGERNGDDALRGRALLGLFELARMRGDLNTARDQARQLEGMLDRHGNAAGDLFLVTSTAATAWVELGDVQAAFAAIERATAVARTPDEKLRIRLTRARALAILRQDPDAAAQAISEAIAEGASASPVARAAAWSYAADLALDRRDSRGANQAIEAIAKSGKTLDLLDKLRAARAHARAVGADGVREELNRLDSPDRTTAFRVELTRALVAIDAGDSIFAAGDLKVLVRNMRDTKSVYGEDERIGLSAWERADVWFRRCDAQLANNELESNDCMKPTPLDKAHREHPVYVRLHLAQARIYAATNPGLESVPLGNAVALLAKAGANRILLAETRLRLVRERGGADRESHARAAREVFADVGRTDEVAELDKIIAEIEGRSSTPPVDAAPPVRRSVHRPARDATGDPWNP